MVILQIEHKVANYEGWKSAFESDPMNRKKLGVRSYRIFRPIDDANYVMIHLEFDNLNQAELTLASLNLLWQQVEGKIMMNPQTRIFTIAEIRNVEY
jgi:hypothetical protein